MKWASKFTLIAALASAAAIGTVGAARADEADRALVRPVPPVVPGQPRLGFYGHLEPRWGMMVDYVLWGMPAFWAGLERGDVIVQINHRRIRSYRDYFGALRTSGPVCRLLVDDVRGRGRIWVFCHLRRRPGPIPLGSPRASGAPKAFDSRVPQMKPPGVFTPPFEEVPPAQTPEAQQNPARPFTSSPEAGPSGSPDSVKGPLL